MEEVDEKVQEEDDEDDDHKTARRLGPTTKPNGEHKSGVSPEEEQEAPRAYQNARGATPDLCSPFGLVVGPKRRAVL